MKILLKSATLILVVSLLNGNKSDLQKSDLPNMDLHVHLNYTANSLGNAAPEAYEKASELSKITNSVLRILLVIKFLYILTACSVDPKFIINQIYRFYETRLEKNR